MRTKANHSIELCVAGVNINITLIQPALQQRNIINLLCVSCVHLHRTFKTMIYPTDFIYYPNKRKFSRNVRNIRISTVGRDIQQSNLKKKVHTEKVSQLNGSASDESIFIRYLNNSTVHGFRYLIDPTIRRTER